VRGTQSKSIRRIARRELLKIAVEKKLTNQQLLAHHYRKLYKALKRAWKTSSKPKSLSYERDSRLALLRERGLSNKRLSLQSTAFEPSIN
jgi:hypothetical protein